MLFFFFFINNYLLCIYYVLMILRQVLPGFGTQMLTGLIGSQSKSFKNTKMLMKLRWINTHWQQAYNLGHWQVIMVFINICDHISPTSVLGNVRKGGLIITVFGAPKHIFSSQYVTPISLELMRYCRSRPAAG